MRMGIDHDERKFHISGKHRRDGGARHAQPREEKLAEDQQVVKRHVDRDGDDAGRHRNARFARFAQRSGVALGDHEGGQTDYHDAQVFKRIIQRVLAAHRIGCIRKVQRDQVLAEQQEQKDSDDCHHRAHDYLVAEAGAHAFIIARAVELR